MRDRKRLTGRGVAALALLPGVAWGGGEAGAKITLPGQDLGQD